MQSIQKPQQKTYRKGGFLRFSAGLIISLLLVITAFEWETPYLLFDEGKLQLDDPRTETVVDNVLQSYTPPPKPAVGSNIVAVKKTPLPIEPIVAKPPVVDVPAGTPPSDTPIEIPGIHTPAETPVAEAKFSRPATPSEGLEAFNRYLHEQIRVPDHLIRRNMGGKIYVSFVVDTNGKLTDIEIIRGFDKELEKQIIKILQEADAWEPAWADGRKVKARMQLPVVISIQ